MNPVERIGRYTLPILDVKVIQQRDKSGWRKFAFWIMPGYNVVLSNGHKIHFTEEEKNLLEEALDKHDLVMQIWGMCKSVGLRG